MDAPLSIQYEFIKQNNNNSYEKADVNEFSSISNFFDTKFFKLLNNISFVYSPYSITYLTLILYLGSTGITKEQFADLFGISNDNKDVKTTVELYHLTSDLLNSENVKIINAYFVDKRLYPHIKKQFLQLLQKISSIIPCNISNSIPNINNWIAKTTDNLIVNAINPSDISHSTQFMALNVIYFKANWLYNFNSVKKGIFNSNDGKQVDVLFMNIVEKFNYYENNETQIIEIPYEFGQFVFGIYLNKTNKLQHFQNLIHKLTTREIELSFPKFIKRQHIDLKYPLQTLGCSRIFEKLNAKLHNMIDMDICLNNIYNDVVIVVNEGDNGLDDKANKKALLKMRVDSPFQYYVRHISTETIILHGYYN